SFCIASPKSGLIAAETHRGVLWRQAARRHSVGRYGGLIADRHAVDYRGAEGVAVHEPAVANELAVLDDDLIDVFNRAGHGAASRVVVLERVVGDANEGLVVAADEIHMRNCRMHCRAAAAIIADDLRCIASGALEDEESFVTTAAALPIFAESYWIST